ncbi:hypothetical protein NFI96_013850 [Prochilodus magdalenae]|nr:hypothetical protein NFI96_013850 [Prochilodus magdalenae]
MFAWILFLSLTVNPINKSSLDFSSARVNLTLFGVRQTPMDGSLSADSRIFMSARVGSSAVLPCDWRNVSSSRPHVEWRTFAETVFEREGGELYQGEGYEDRVDVPEDKLQEGDCSLELRNIRPDDAGVYESYLLVRRVRRALHSRRVLIQSVELSVDGSLTAQSRIYMSAKVGSTAVLPCDWRNISSTQLSSPHVEWRTFAETVFERKGGELYQGEEYENRVDVPEDRLLKGNCSLVLRNIRPDDAGVYESYLLVRRARRGLHSRRVLIQSVELSVDGKETKLKKRRNDSNYPTDLHVCPPSEHIPPNHLRTYKVWTFFRTVL